MTFKQIQISIILLILIKSCILYSDYTDFNIKTNEDDLVIKSLRQLIPKIITSQHSVLLIKSCENTINQDVTDISEHIIQMTIQQNIPILSIDVKCLMQSQCTRDRLYKQHLNIFIVDDVEGFRFIYELQTVFLAKMSFIFISLTE